MKTDNFSKNLLSLPQKTVEKMLAEKSFIFWHKRGERMAMSLFKKMAAQVPAYKDILKKNKVDSNKIHTISDFKNLPILSKQNYLLQYPLEKLCWKGKLQNQQAVFSSTSGTTGEPFFFPRTLAQDQQYAFLAELYLNTNFNIKTKTTLYIDAFALGNWIGGIFTYQAVRLVAEKGKYKLSITTPGLNILEVIKILKQLSPKYAQTIIAGYPPFIKDVLDTSGALGINLKTLNLKFIFSAEPFTENFRDYIAELAGLKNQFLNTLNHYGTVDQGTHAYETPITILLRKLAEKHPRLKAQLFSLTARLPTVCQYFPEQFFFENIDNRLICSSFSGLPLVRYDLKDTGNIFKLSDAFSCSESANVDLKSEIQKVKISRVVWDLPFVTVYERSDNVLSWHGANIYPEHIRDAHIASSLKKKLTGKFSMRLISDSKHNMTLQINSELAKNALKSNNLSIKLLKEILQSLTKKNSEFKNNYSLNPAKNTPEIVLHQYHSDPYFKLNGKQKWILKT